MTLLLFYYLAVIFKQNIKKNKTKPNSQYLGQSNVTTTNTAVNTADARCGQLL